jgi:hypothetical protein
LSLEISPPVGGLKHNFMCPICTVGLAAGVGLSRWLKVDDVISGLWIGALILALSIWTFNWLLKKKDKKPFWILLVCIIFWYLLTFIPFHYMGLLDTTCQKILGLNRLVFGGGLGIIIATIALKIEGFARKGEEKKRLFPFQKVIIPTVILLITSIILQVGWC